MKIIETFDQSKIKDDWKTQYIRYRIGRLKHQYWLWNRKRRDQAIIEKYDLFILKNCQPGITVFYASSGYYLKEIYPEIEAVEMHPVVKTFCPSVHVCDRNKLDSLPFKADNFAVVNNRADLWVNLNGLTDHVRNYIHGMHPGCRFFYSFRDTQITHLNRLTIDMEQYFLAWAQSLNSLGLDLVWSDLNFKKKIPDANGYYDTMENPDVTNGNLKFAFVYNGAPWDIVT